MNQKAAKTRQKRTLKSQTLMDTARWRISPSTRVKMDEYEKWLEKKKRETEKRQDDK